ncbi:MAG: carbohydrate ABC transporter permease [Candidatus Bipolaricaulota bacterium]|nr:carbohydrate ABC transporter permease [Candidatus Bipolaricaulota bacterium]
MKLGISRKSFIYLVLIIYSAFVTLPILWVFTTSLQPGGTVHVGFMPGEVTLENYRYILTEPLMLRSLANSFIVASLATVISVVVSAMAGFAFSNRYRFKGKGALMGIVLGIFMIPIVVNTIPLYITLQSIGWLNTYWALILPYQALILPLNVFLMRNFFNTIPKELEESAMVDGCSRFGAFRRVTLPLAWPGLAVASMFAFRFSWNEFVFAITFISGRKMRTFQAALYWFMGLEKASWGYLTAGVIVGMIPVVLMFFIFQRRFIEGLTMGAIKE